MNITIQSNGNGTLNLPVKRVVRKDGYFHLQFYRPLSESETEKIFEICGLLNTTIYAGLTSAKIDFVTFSYVLFKIWP